MFNHISELVTSASGYVLVNQYEYNLRSINCCAVTEIRLEITSLNFPTIVRNCHGLIYMQKDRKIP